MAREGKGLSLPARVEHIRKTLHHIAYAQLYNVVGRTMTTSHRQARSLEEDQAVSVYTDHSQDPIADVLAFVYFRATSSGGRPVIDAGTNEGTTFTETNRSTVAPEVSVKPSDAQNKIEDFRLFESGNRPAPFPWVLYCLLEDSLNNGMHRIISWSDHGRSFEVYDRDRFEAHVMPR